MSANTILTSVVTGGSNNHTTTAEEVNALATDFVTAGVVGTISLNTGSGGSGSFCVNADASPDMGVTIKSGQAYITATPSSQNSQVLRARTSSDYTTYTINANSSGSTKYDWIYLSVDATKANSPAADASDVSSFVTSRSSSNTVDNGTPPTYGILLAVVTVANGASSITNANITDRRTQAAISQTGSSNATSWNNLQSTLSYSANNGNKEVVLNSSADVSGVVTPGMRLQATRGTTAPTQCMAFTAASSQYASKSSPSGITFTSAFTAEAWIYLNSYTGSNQFIISRENGTSGWGLFITPGGQVSPYFGSGSSFTNFFSYQAVPLKRWVHVAGVVSSVSSKTAAIYINGVSVPIFSSGTATTLTQPSSNLNVGAYNTPANYFDGYLSEVRLWSAARTAQNIQDNMAVSLTGSETNLIGLFQGNGNFNDKTSNGNNLTQSGGAVATQSANPYNNTELGIITKVTSSQLTVFTGTDYNLPNMTLTSPQYSTAKAPYGFPADSGKWMVEYLQGASATAGGSGSSMLSATIGNVQVSIPAGPWDLRGFLTFNKTGVDGYVGLSTSTSTATDSRLYHRWYLNATGIGQAIQTAPIAAPITNTAQTVWYGIGNPSGTTSFGFRGMGDDAADFLQVRAYCGYI